MPNKFFLYDYKVCDIVTMRKKHPCGSNEWIVANVGCDIKLRCRGCDHLMSMDRTNLEKNTVKVVKPESGSN
ncbi:MAG: DUF951 domain-containing protein [Clostridia bacterium]|nr:DUF951 domain-containing protein [Clostridia bacterium]